MKITTKEVRNVTAQLDEIIEKYNEKQEDKKRDWRTYEQQFAHRLRIAYRELEPLVCEAVKSLIFSKRKVLKTLTAVVMEQVMLLLLRKIMSQTRRNSKIK